MSLNLPLRYAVIDTYFLKRSTVKAVVPLYIASGYGSDTYAKASISIGSNVYSSNIGKIGANASVETVVEIEIPNYGSGSDVVVKDATVCLEAYQDPDYSNLLGKCCKPMKFVFIDTSKFLSNAVVVADPDLGDQNVDKVYVREETELVLDGSKSYCVQSHCVSYREPPCDPGYIHSTYNHVVPSGKIAIASAAITFRNEGTAKVFTQALGALADNVAMHFVGEWGIISVALDEGTNLNGFEIAYGITKRYSNANYDIIVVDRAIILELDKSTIGL